MSNATAKKQEQVMKIEKINDNQIRCTLTQADLEERQLRLTELAYGSEKAKQLFREMMLKAYKEYGWSNETNIPLMIEAVPMRENGLILTITKVEDPEELDTRFSRFTPTDVLPDDETIPEIEGADDILDVFRKFFDQKKAAQKQGKKGRTTPAADGNPQEADDGKTGEAAEASVNEKMPGTKKAASAGKKAAGETDAASGKKPPVLTRAFRFDNLEEVILAAKALRGFYNGDNSLYHLRKEGNYLLAVHQAAHTPEDFNRICNILTEYAHGENFSAAAEAYLTEHGSLVIRGEALQKLAGLTE